MCLVIDPPPPSSVSQKGFWAEVAFAQELALEMWFLGKAVEQPFAIVRHGGMAFDDRLHKQPLAALPTVALLVQQAFDQRGVVTLGGRFGGHERSIRALGTRDEVFGRRATTPAAARRIGGCSSRRRRNCNGLATQLTRRAATRGRRLNEAQSAKLRITSAAF